MFLTAWAMSFKKGMVTIRWSEVQLTIFVIQHRADFLSHDSSRTCLDMFLELSPSGWVVQVLKGLPQKTLTAQQATAIRLVSNFLTRTWPFSVTLDKPISYIIVCSHAHDLLDTIECRVEFNNRNFLIESIIMVIFNSSVICELEK